MQRSSRFEGQHQLVRSIRKRRLYVLRRLHDLLSTKTPTKQQRRQRRRRAETPLNNHVCTNVTRRWTRQQSQHQRFPFPKHNTQPTDNPSPTNPPYHHPPTLRLLLRLPNPLPPPPNLRNPRPLRKRPPRHNRRRNHPSLLPTRPRIHLSATRNPTTNPTRDPRPQTHSSGRTETTPPSLGCGRRRGGDRSARTTPKS